MSLIKTFISRLVKNSYSRKIATYLSISMTDIVIKEEQLLQSIEKTLNLIQD